MVWNNNRPKHVPTVIRNACLTRDNHQCTATMQDGTRCPETTQLEAAHRTQYHPAETLTVEDVRTLCHWHHNRETQRQAATARQATRTNHAAHPRPKHPGLA